MFGAGSFEHGPAPAAASLILLFSKAMLFEPLCQSTYSRRPCTTFLYGPPMDYVIACMQKITTALPSSAALR